MAAQPCSRMKIKSSYPAAILLLLFTTSLALPDAGARKTAVYDDPEGYQILSLMLEDEAASWKLDRVGIYGYAVNSESMPCRRIPQEFREAVEDLTRKPKMRFRAKFALKHKYELHSIWGATDFGITAVSFNSSRTMAVAAVIRGCGAMCSSGSTYLFRKVEGIWQKVDQVCETLS